MAYIKKLIEVPTLPPVCVIYLSIYLSIYLFIFQDPPNFLIGSYIDDLQLSQQVIVQQFSEDSLQRTSTLDGTLIELQGSPSTLNEEVCMYVYMYVCMCMCIYVCMYVCMYISMYVCCVYVCVYV